MDKRDGDEAKMAGGQDKIEKTRGRTVPPSLFSDKILVITVRIQASVNGEEEWDFLCTCVLFAYTEPYLSCKVKILTSSHFCFGPFFLSRLLLVLFGHLKRKETKLHTETLMLNV